VNLYSASTPKNQPLMRWTIFVYNMPIIFARRKRLCACRYKLWKGSIHTKKISRTKIRLICCPLKWCLAFLLFMRFLIVLCLLCLFCQF